MESDRYGNDLAELRALQAAAKARMGQREPEARSMGYEPPASRGQAGGLARKRQLAALPRARRQPRCRTRQQALALRYRQRQPTRKQLEAAYIEDGGRSDGAPTFAETITEDWVLWRAKGAQATTTGPRRAKGLAAAGRPRCARTVRRHRARAVRLGFAAYHHVKHSAAERHRDHLRVEVFTKMSTCLRQQEQTTLRAVCSPALYGKNRDSAICDRQMANRAPPGEIGPPYGGSGSPPARPAGTNGSTQEEEPPAQLVAHCEGDVSVARRLWARRRR